jgi:hypothetical protein
MFRAKAKPFVRTIGAITLLCGALGAVQAATIWVGSNATGPLERYTSTGTFEGTFGADATTGVALDGMGHVYTVQPDDLSSSITKYGADQTWLSTVIFEEGTDNGNGFPGYISDMTYGGGSLWLAGFNGIVYRINTAGSVLSSFDTGATFTGIAFDGTYLYTSQGFGGGAIEQRGLDGTLVSTIFTGLPEIFGLGYDSEAGTLWAGGLDVVTQVSLTGELLNTLSIAGFHDGLEVGDIGTTVIPEPGAFLLVGPVLGAALHLRRRGFARVRRRVV